MDVEINILVTLFLFVLFFTVLTKSTVTTLLDIIFINFFFDEDLPYGLKICLLRKIKSKIEMKYGMELKKEEGLLEKRKYLDR